MISLTGQRFRRALLAAGTAAAFVLAVPVTPAHTAPVVSLDCNITATSDVHPGEIFGVLQQLAGTTHGLTGTADCTGTVDGQAVTGPGQFGANSQEVGDCGATQTIGQNEFVLQIPTTDGTKTVSGRYTDTVLGTSRLHRRRLLGRQPIDQRHIRHQRPHHLTADTQCGRPAPALRRQLMAAAVVVVVAEVP